MFGINMDKEYQRLQAFYEAAQGHLDDPKQRQATASTVSGWSVGEHLHHTTLVNTAILRQMQQWLTGDLETRQGTPNMAGRLVLWLGRLPRGRGRSPAAFVPERTVEVVDAFRESQAHLEALGPDLDALRQCSGGLPHPALGVLAAPQWLRFARIHSEHHLAIIRDILAHA
jgi:hypothetical protein